MNKMTQINMQVTNIQKQNTERAMLTVLLLISLKIVAVEVVLILSGVEIVAGWLLVISEVEKVCDFLKY